jgi:hypothetical protein
MFRVQKGVTAAVKSIYASNGLIRDIAVKPPADKLKKARAKAAPANEYASVEFIHVLCLHTCFLPKKDNHTLSVSFSNFYCKNLQMFAYPTWIRSHNQSYFKSPQARCRVLRNQFANCA